MCSLLSNLSFISRVSSLVCDVARPSFVETGVISVGPPWLVPLLRVFVGWVASLGEFGLPWNCLFHSCDPLLLEMRFGLNCRRDVCFCESSSLCLSNCCLTDSRPALGAETAVAISFLF